MSRADPGDAHAVLLGRALAFAERFYAERAGETLIVGLAGMEPLLSFAAGIGTEKHRTHLATLARYLFAGQGADGYLVVMPAELGDREVLALECRTAGSGRVYSAAVERDAAGNLRGLGEPEPRDGESPLLGDLLAPAGSLPGIMRRELDRAYAALRVDFPGGG